MTTNRNKLSFIEILEKIKQQGFSLKEIDSYEFNDKELEQIYLTAIDVNVKSILDIPESRRTHTIYLAAIKKNVEVLTIIPTEQITDEMIYTVMQTNYEGLNALSIKLNHNILSFNTVLELLKRDGQKLEFIQQAINLSQFKEKEEELYLAAVNSFPPAIQYVPEPYREKLDKIMNMHNNPLDQIETVAMEFLKALDNFKEGILKINFNHLDGRERITAEEEEKERLMKTWINQNKKLLFPLLSKLTSDKDTAWEFFLFLIKKMTDGSDKKLEIIMMEGNDDFNPAISADIDFTNVIEMLFIRGNEKNKNYLIIPSVLVNRLYEYAMKENKICNIPIDTLSFLQHWSLERTTTEIQATQIASMVKKFPNLNRLVLRGCSTTGSIKKEDLIFFNPKKIKIVGSKNKIQNENLNDDELLFQQEINKEKNIIITKIRYKDHNKEIIFKELDSIPLNIEKNKLSPEVEQSLALQSKKYNLPPLSLQSPDMKTNLVKSREDWLSNKSLSQNDKIILQSVEKNVRTFTVDKFPEKSSLVSAVESRLELANIKIPEIKAYGASYRGYKSGPMVEKKHGHHQLPKAMNKKFRFG